MPRKKKHTRKKPKLMQNTRRKANEILKGMAPICKSIEEGKDTVAQITRFRTSLANCSAKTNRHGVVTINNIPLKGCHSVIEQKILRPAGLTEAKVYQIARQSRSGGSGGSSGIYIRRTPMQVGRALSDLLFKNFKTPVWFNSRVSVKLTRYPATNAIFYFLLKGLLQSQLLPMCAEFPVGDRRRAMGTRVDLIVYDIVASKFRVVELKYASADTWRTVVKEHNKTRISPRMLAAVQLELTHRLASASIPYFAELFARPLLIRISGSTFEKEIL